MSGFEKAVKGATKVKLAPPKSKYIEHILRATTSDAGTAEVFRTLTLRLRDSTWTIAFKALIVVHLMIKEGAQNMTLKYLAVAPRNRLAINSFTDVQTQGHNIRCYAEYLLSRAYAFEKAKTDHVRVGSDHMKNLSVARGLLRETEIVQEQVKVLVKCDLLSNDVENEISLTAFRLLTRDLLDLYNVENEAVMNVLSHYFEMSRPDAERAIKIYKTFCKQTEAVVKYLSVARQYEHATRLEIPKLKHAPTSLATSLQDYLDDKDFEVNRRQYLAEQEARKNGKPSFTSSQAKAQPSAAKSAASFSQPAASSSTSAAKGPAPNLIDFFESIETNQQTMETNPFLRQQPQQQPQFQQIPQQQQYQMQMSQNTGFPSAVQTVSFDQFQPTSEFSPGASQQTGFQQQSQLQPIPSQATGAGFGGFGPQPTGQQVYGGYTQEPQSFANPTQQSAGALQPQTTNPFRQSMMMTGGASQFNGAFAAPPLPQPERQGTNPFSRSTLPASIPEDGIPQQPVPQQTAFQSGPLQAQPTGTNPFARNLNPPVNTTSPPPAPLTVQATGSTNPFRQSAFVNQSTGQGWQRGPQGTMGGLENMETIPVFPRPGQVPQQQSQQQQSPWL